MNIKEHGGSRCAVDTFLHISARMQYARPGAPLPSTWVDPIYPGGKNDPLSGIRNSYTSEWNAASKEKREYKKHLKEMQHEEEMERLKDEVQKKIHRGDYDEPTQR